MKIGTGLRQKQKKKRGLAVLSCVLLFISLAFVWRVVDANKIVFQFQEYFSSIAPSPISENSVRGTLYDRNYRELAVSLPRVSVFARTREIEALSLAAEALAPILETDSEKLLTKLQGTERRIWLAKNISQQQEDAIAALDISGIYFSKEHSRYYPRKTEAAHLIGFVEDDIGLAGAEYYYDRLVQKMLTQNSERNYQGGVGQHVVLTLDLKVQEILENLVNELTAGRQNAQIGAYAMDAGTGAVVAAVQIPSFDPNRYRRYPQNQLENLLLKPMLLPPAIRMVFRDSAAIHSQYEMRGEAHPWSISATQLNLGGELRLWENLGLDARTSEEFGNNEHQVIRAAGHYVVSDTGGYEFGTVPESLTPLNVLRGLSILLNGGKMIVPHLAQSVIDEAGDGEYQLKADKNSQVIQQVIGKSVSREISRMLSTVGTRDRVGGVTIHGKVQANLGSEEGYHSVSNELYFAAVPIQRAELSLLLTIQAGSRNVPFKMGTKLIDPGKALAEVLPRIAVLQEVGKSIAEVAEPSGSMGGNFPVNLDRVHDVVRISKGRSALEVADPGDMPALVGLSLRKSLRLLQNSSCTIRIFGTGRVVEQRPKAGTSLVGVEECVIRMQQQEDVTLEALEEKMSEKK